MPAEAAVNDQRLAANDECERKQFEQFHKELENNRVVLGPYLVCGTHA